MEAHRLTEMANQIAAFFDAYPEEQAVTATADHLRQFWDPRMRAQLKEAVATGEDLDILPTALSAIRRIG
jgi:formate dehydrogenase subunit delta